MLSNSAETLLPINRYLFYAIVQRRRFVLLVHKRGRGCVKILFDGGISMVQVRGFWLLSKEREVVCMYSCKLQMQHWRFGQIWCNIVRPSQHRVDCTAAESTTHRNAQV